MNIVLSVMVLTVFALLGGAALVRQRGGSSRQSLLMVVLALVVAANVALWVWPTPSGQSLAGSRASAPR